jgi:hypothetical protein
MTQCEEAGFSEMRARSGSVDSADPLACVLYMLIRDGNLAPGSLENAVDQALCGKSFQFSNGWLASYAMDVAARLRRPADASPES